MRSRSEVSEFLRSRRARLRPENFGLPGQGLRREELAGLAGVSVEHYAWLEQGRGRQFSPSVLDAVARVLRLDGDERAYLHRIAASGGAGPEPAYVVGRRSEVLAWNRLAAALVVDFGAMEARNRTFARFVFLDETSRRLYANWSTKASDVAAYLRRSLGRHPDDLALRALIDEYTASSPDFRHFWEERRVGAGPGADHVLRPARLPRGGGAAPARRRG
ncbi:helix-turn-helix transcriptional regulator [Allokutzneria sp. NRRL B-24872]|uniref:helix-turn-helix transcriptional regulator n=1 Tax=Allokutzneria sp. NRRL B-24872 TaxID=1137961 RepID=UPI001FEED069|nr:helix-turn-helix transcriptional regulator [Allokutzneria sp. NRRL B-24872]